MVGKQWGTNAWENTNTEINIKYPIAFPKSCIISLATLVQSNDYKGHSVTVQIGDFTDRLTEINLLYTNTNLVSVIYALRSYWLSFGK